MISHLPGDKVRAIVPVFLVFPQDGRISTRKWQNGKLVSCQERSCVVSRGSQEICRGRLFVLVMSILVAFWFGG